MNENKISLKIYICIQILLIKTIKVTKTYGTKKLIDMMT